MRSGYKYARCMQCGKWWNVCMQFTGWYVCPKCRCRKENEHGK
nr:MAG TPA: DNA-directed RNA polymerase [Caudoviricetes sp.]